MTRTQLAVLLGWIALLASGTAIAGIIANETITLDRHASVIACVEAGGRPLDCREALR